MNRIKNYVNIMGVIVLVIWLATAFLLPFAVGGVVLLAPFLTEITVG